MRILTFYRIAMACCGAVLVNVTSGKNSELLLGPTGMSGHFRGNGIEISQIEDGSPAHGKIKVGAFITGINGSKFRRDIRRHYAEALDEAESEEAGGRLNLIFSDKSSVELQLDVLGTYSNIAPFNCPKSNRIIEQAAEYLANSINDKMRERDTYNSSATHAALLGLLATGERKYINLAGKAIESSYFFKPDRKDIKAQLAGEVPMNKVAWHWGYHCILLGEYFLLTGDRGALDALEIYALALARGQDAGGLYGHTMAVEGRLPGYAQMNQTSLSCLVGMLMARRCGISNPDLDAGIAKTHAYYASYIGKGGFNYGVHPPDRKRFNNNGMSGSAAMSMALSQNKEGVRFFSGLCATSYDNLQQGHASNFFNPLWTPLGANLAGPEITHRFFMNSLWFYTNNRSWDGSFRRNGEEQGRAGSHTGAALLAYCLPRKALIITGKEQDTNLWLKGAQATGVIEMSQIDYEKKSTDELIALFEFPYPQVRLSAIWKLRKRDPDFLPQLSEMLVSGNRLQKTSTLDYFGYQCPLNQVFPHIGTIGSILRNENEDPEMRAIAASTLSHHGEAAHLYYDDMLRLIIEDEPEDQFGDVDLTVGKSLNQLCSNPHASDLVKNKELFYAAAQKLINHKRQHARSAGIKMLADIPIEDFHYVADKLLYIIEDSNRSYHSYHAWQSSIGPAIQILAHLNIKEGIELATGVLDREGGKWGFKVRMLCAALSSYGANAERVLIELKKDERLENIEESKFSWVWNSMVEAIEEDKSPEELISLKEALRRSMRH